MTEHQKMLNGMIYDGNKEGLDKERIKAHKLCKQFNDLDEDDSKRKELLDQIFPNKGKNLVIAGNLMVDYGIYTSFGDDCYANFNLTILDTCQVKIGNRVFFGPNVSIYTPIHPFISGERKYYINDDNNITDMEYGKPITIGDDCWICGSVVILPGVNIGNRCIIGAGSVVSRDIEDDSLAYGNPAKVVRKITKDDSVFLKKNLFENETEIEKYKNR